LYKTDSKQKPQFFLFLFLMSKLAYYLKEEIQF